MLELARHRGKGARLRDDCPTHHSAGATRLRVLPQPHIALGRKDQFKRVAHLSHSFGFHERRVKELIAIEAIRFILYEA